MNKVQLKPTEEPGSEEGITWTSDLGPGRRAGGNAEQGGQETNQHHSVLFVPGRVTVATGWCVPQKLTGGTPPPPVFCSSKKGQR